MHSQRGRNLAAWLQSYSYKQKIAVAAPIVLLATMVGAFRLLARNLDNPLTAWSLGLAIYWLTWCTLLPLGLVGMKGIGRLLRPRKPTLLVVFLVVFPAVMASLSKVATGMGYDKPQSWVWLLYLCTALGNGFFEELLWRGVYLELFPRRVFFQLVWPTLFFALWHYAPATVSANPNTPALMVGAGLFGMILGILAGKTGGIWWCVVAHVVGAVVMVV